MPDRPLKLHDLQRIRVVFRLLQKDGITDRDFYGR